jgi:hypothetical protein
MESVEFCALLPKDYSMIKAFILIKIVLLDAKILKQLLCCTRKSIFEIDGNFRDGGNNFFYFRK